MKKRIVNDLELCTGCNRCIRVCPIEEANVAQQNGSRITVQINHEKCIACGACISVCHHNSRDYEDDTEQFFADLHSGVPMALFSAPALKTNFDNWEQILAWFRTLGVQKIFDVSLGADICTWAHIRYLQRHGDKRLISQPCPAIVNYIVKHRSELLEHLSPVHSPMLCTTVYMRKYEQVNTKIAALSPCIAKAHEFEATGQVDYNITFRNLFRYLQRNAPVLPTQSGGFDHFESGLGFLYPMPGGLKENVEHYLGKAVRVDKAEGPHSVYKALDEYARQPEQFLPTLFDVLNCAEGCNGGTGCLHESKSVFEMNATLSDARQNALEQDGAARLDELYEHFDKNLRLEDFLRQYSPAPVQPLSVTPQAIENAFVQLGKMDEESRNFSCGACGSDSCLDMAKKIAKGVNTPLNCIEKAHRDISRQHAESLEFQADNIRNLDTILGDIAEIKSAMEDILSNMDSVTDSVRDFQQMTREIQKIAMQINIISLNASIEAARAGQFGKAFGVVAEEIRSLANSSRASVQNSEHASDNATSAIGFISDKIMSINDNINQSYQEISLISDKTRELVQTR